MAVIRVRFEPAGITTSVPAGSTIKDAAVAAGVPLDVPCGGIGRCRGCRVRSEGALFAPDVREHEALSDDELADGVRLACIARVDGDVTVHARASRRDRMVGAALEEADGRELGVALDLGTTTLSAALIDVGTGDEVGVVSAANPQVAYGADVMSRIAAAAGGALEPMREATAEAIDALVAQLIAASGSRPNMAVAGNTAMLHVLAGEDPSGLGTAPYEPLFLDERATDGAALGLHTVGSVALLPGISAFVGADVLAGLLATRLLDHDGTVLFIDVGTNGEIVLKTAEGNLFATSAAAGPAFEAASIELGMCAADGAIERVSLEDDDLTWTVMGGSTPRGLCGSGVIDLVAAAVDGGLIGPDGLIQRGIGGKLGERVVEVDGVVAIRLAEGVWFSQRDVRQVQLAKGAVAAATALLLETAGCKASDVQAVLVAGEFGSSLLPAALATLGLIADQWTGLTSFVGNGSRAGAARWLAEPGSHQEANALRAATTVVELATHPDFQGRFVGSLGFPERS